MSSGFYSNNTDLDNIFAPWVSGMSFSVITGYKTGGADLNQRYAPLSYGSAAAVTGYTIPGGADLNTIFAKIGSTAIVITVQPSNVSGSAAAGAPSGTVISSSYMTCSATGGHPPYTYTWHVSGGAVASSPNAPTTFISATVNASSSVTGTAYCTIQDSTGRSINTNSASYSLTNTSQYQIGFGFIAKFNAVDDAVAYRSQSFYGAGPATQNATPTEPVKTFSGNQQVIALGWIGPGGGTLTLTVYSLNGVALPQSFLQSLTVAGQTLSGASATFTHSPSTAYAEWTWPQSVQTLISGNSYTASLIYNP